MPVQSCTSDGKPGFKWGDSGKCYTYTPGDEGGRDRARSQAAAQGQAIQAQQNQGKAKAPAKTKGRRV